MITTEEEMDEQLENYDPWDDDDRCYECRGYGDDYSFDEDGEIVDNCVNCPFNSANNDWDD